MNLFYPAPIRAIILHSTEWPTTPSRKCVAPCCQRNPALFQPIFLGVPVNHNSVSTLSARLKRTAESLLFLVNAIARLGETICPSGPMTFWTIGIHGGNNGGFGASFLQHLQT